MTAALTFAATYPNLRVTSLLVERRINEMLEHAERIGESEGLARSFKSLNDMCLRSKEKPPSTEIRLFTDSAPLSLYWTWNRLSNTHVIDAPFLMNGGLIFHIKWKDGEPDPERRGDWSIHT